MTGNDTNPNQSIVVIGAGQAGFSLCARLRELGHQGPITLVGDEPHRPYQRPPLSKGYLLGDATRDKLLLRPDAFYEDQRITTLSGVSAVAIHPEEKTVTLSSKSVLTYETLVLATGATPRKLPANVAGDLGGIYYVRNIADADAIASELKPGGRALVVGGGYVGLEAAATATKHGVQVTLIEAADRILQRVACPETSDYFRELHQSHGVEILEAVGLSSIEGENGRVTRAVLSNGEELSVDFVLVGIGVLPNDQLARAAGLACDNGIRVDDRCRTSGQNIYAIGDCSSFPYDVGYIRLESVGHAIDHAQAAAANIMGQDQPYRAKPWFWSDQYDVKLQIAGLSTGYNTVITRCSGGPVKSHWYFCDDRLLAVDAMNEARAYMVAKRLIDAGRSAAPDAIANPDLDLKSLL